MSSSALYLNVGRQRGALRQDKKLVGEEERKK